MNMFNLQSHEGCSQVSYSIADPSQFVPYKSFVDMDIHWRVRVLFPIPQDTEQGVQSDQQPHSPIERMEKRVVDIAKVAKVNSVLLSTLTFA